MLTCRLRQRLIVVSCEACSDIFAARDGVTCPVLSSVALCSIVVSTIGVQAYRHSLEDQNTAFFGVWLVFVSSLQQWRTLLQLHVHDFLLSSDRIVCDSA